MHDGSLNKAALSVPAIAVVHPTAGSGRESPTTKGPCNYPMAIVTCLLLAVGHSER